MAILDNIKKENDIKKLKAGSLNDLSKEIREFIIENVSKTGGHLASNLGAVELTIALHRCMTFPEDKLIFDVGHQSYTHKILTGRKSGFSKLRKLDGMSGFPKSIESASDPFNTGHSSTSISAALGYCVARDLKGGKEKVCAVIGDGSLTGGMAYEALDRLAQLRSQCVIIVNDNQMSIGKNVGGLSKALNHIRVSDTYNDMKSNVESALQSIPAVGFKMARGIKRSKDSIRNILIHDNIFEEMGLTYVGPIDGHNIEEMVSTFKEAFSLNKPIVIHVCTKKGKGYPLAEKYPEHFHGVAPFDIETGRTRSHKTGATNTDVFAKELVCLGSENEKIVAITAAMAQGTGVSLFRRHFPKRTFDVGIAEQHAVTFAAGLAKGGMIPVVAIYSSFLQRAYDQILHDVCLQRLHVIFAIDRSGLVGPDGETHQGIYDTSFLREMPGLTILAPKGAKEIEMALDYAINECDGPVAIKYSRAQADYSFDEFNEPFKLGHSEMIHDFGFNPMVVKKEMDYKKKISIVSVGNMMEVSKEVADLLKERCGIVSRLINARFIKPIDKNFLKETAEESDIMVVVEENVRRGSFGEALCYELYMSGVKTELLHCCIDAEMVPHGGIGELRERLGLDPESIYNKIYIKL